MINGSLAHVLYIVGPACPQIHPVVVGFFFPPIPECIIGIDKLQNWWNSHIGSLACGVRAIFI